MKKLFLIAAVIISAFSVNAQAVSLLWAKSFGNPNQEILSSVTVDAAGNVYSTGYFQSVTDFDPGPGSYTLATNGSLDIFITKFDASGNFVWARNMGGSGFDWGYTIKVDATGNIYTAGYFSNTADFDPGVGIFTITAVGMYDIFVNKLDAAGNFIWAKSMGGAGEDIAFALTLDASGNIFTTGYYEQTADFDPGVPVFNMTSNGTRDIFISKLNNSGVFQWAKSIGGAAGGDVGYSIAVDATGNVFTTGYFVGVVDFDPGLAVSNLTAVSIDAYVNKLDVSGNFVWAQDASGGNFSVGTSLSLDATGNIYTAGYFNTTADFDPGAGVSNLTSAGFFDIYVSKLNPAGNFVWAKGMGGTADDFGYSLALDAFGSVYTTGYFNNTADFDPGPGTFTIASNGLQDIFINKLDATGNFVWTKNLGGISDDKGYAITIDASNKLYLAGIFQSTVDFDPGPLTNSLVSAGPSDDAFVLKFDQCFTPSSPSNTTPVSNQTACVSSTSTLSATGSGTINWYATNASTTSLGSGTNFVTPSFTAAGTYTFYAEANTCTVSASRTPITVTVSVCLGLTNNSPTLSSVKIYPNPTNGILNVDLGIINGDEAKVQITNLLGQIVLIETTNMPHSSYNIQHLQSGLYICKIEMNGQSKTIRLIKE